MAKALENNGATVYIVGRRREVLDVAVREHSKFGRIIPLQGDITDRSSLLSLATSVKDRHGYIDLLVNNAGIARNLFPHPLPSPTEPSSDSGASIKAFQDALWNCGSPSDFTDTFSTNVMAPYYTTIAFLELLHSGNTRRLREQGQQVPHGVSVPYQTSQVLTVSSSGGFRIDAKVLSPSYTLAKAATTHLGKLLANLLAPWGIRSNVLAPGVFPSEMTVAMAPGVKLDPTSMAGKPLFQDMTGTILFLASRAGAYVNGAIWLVDGGRVSNITSTLSY
ncbi:NAD(P)-binding protein [Coprinellus micaceus]|uniref:NAD(P)-binding protein n=1 Tax=Coprinellus micaceus TaxID=71717 RepID=A0A4Y7SQY7_COPMI|nr:NAD(P)-binding protein [Coprinellus micaceus]